MSVTTIPQTPCDTARASMLYAATMVNSRIGSTKTRDTLKWRRKKDEKDQKPKFGR